MQLRVSSALVIYTGSYLPLSLILLCQNIDPSYYAYPICTNWARFSSECSIPLKNPIFAVSFFALCLSCFFVALLTLKAAIPKHEVQIKESKYIPSDLMNYVLPYIVSFMSLDYQDPSKFIGFAIFLLWIFWVTYKSGLIILNPLFVAFGWKLYEIKYAFAGSPDEFNGITLSRTEIIPKSTYKQITIQDVLIIKN